MLMLAQGPAEAHGLPEQQLDPCMFMVLNRAPPSIKHCDTRLRG